MTIRFKRYGDLPYIEPEDYYRLNAILWGKAVSEDGDPYDIIMISTEDGQQLACGNV